MAEIRKHKPDVSNPIDAALQAALGEPVRPVTPGGPARPTRASEATPVTPTQITHVTVGDGSWVQFPTHSSPHRPTEPVEPPAQD